MLFLVRSGIKAIKKSLQLEVRAGALARMGYVCWRQAYPYPARGGKVVLSPCCTKVTQELLANFEALSPETLIQLVRVGWASTQCKLPGDADVQPWKRAELASVCAGCLMIWSQTWLQTKIRELL